MNDITREMAIKAWLETKKEEKRLAEKRRKIEDFLSSAYADDELMPEPDGSKTLNEAGCRVRITSRVTRKVDLRKVREITIANGLEQHLDRLFRFSAEINKSNWKLTSESITRLFDPAITVSESRPTYSIEEEK